MITLDAISLDARAVLIAYWGILPTGQLNFMCREAVPSPRMQAALDELVELGVIKRVRFFLPPAQTYEPTDLAEPLAVEARNRHWPGGLPDTSDLPSFPFTVPIAEAGNE